MEVVKGAAAPPTPGAWWAAVREAAYALRGRELSNTWAEVVNWTSLLTNPTSGVVVRQVGEIIGFEHLGRIYTQRGEMYIQPSGVYKLQ